MSTFHRFEVVCRGSGTQPQVGGNFNYLFHRFKRLILVESDDKCAKQPITLPC